jgi:8-oxo-dGTP pyrophosphatase MutT (NUDIX family)
MGTGSEEWGVRVASALAAHQPRDAAPAGFRRAAVLVPLSATGAGLTVLLTRRSDRVPTHKGQISFPGGGFQPADGELRVTALREAEEEIGLRPGDVTLLGRLDDTLAAVSTYVVRPFVGLIPHPYPFRPDPYEIAEVLQMPLAPLLAGAEFRAEVWERDGPPRTVYFYDWAGQTIWGLTARILKQLVELLRAGGEGRPAR